MILKQIALFSIAFATTAPVRAPNFKATVNAPGIKPLAVAALSIAPAGTAPKIGANVAEVLGAQELNAAVTPAEAGGMTGVAEGRLVFDRQPTGNDYTEPVVAALPTSSIRRPTQLRPARVRGGILSAAGRARASVAALSMAAMPTGQLEDPGYLVFVIMLAIALSVFYFKILADKQKSQYEKRRQEVLVDYAHIPGVIDVDREEFTQSVSLGGYDTMEGTAVATTVYFDSQESLNHAIATGKFREIPDTGFYFSTDSVVGAVGPRPAGR